MANGKKSKKKIIIFSIIGIVLIGLVLLVILGSNRETIITVQTEKIERRTITQIVSATGKIQPEMQVKINAEVSGEIIELPVREGQRVGRGQLLVKIKPDQYRAQVEQAEASVMSQEARLAQAEDEYKRISELHSKGLSSASELISAKTSFQTSKASADQANASLRQQRENLSKTTIYSTMDGIVSQLNTELGERVSGSTFTQGTLIMTIADLSRMEARVDVSENDIVMVSVSDTARIEVDAFPAKKFNGTVTRIANTAKSTGLGSQDQITNFEVRILVKTPEGVQFRPGMTLTADVETETKPNVLAVPIQSVTVRMPKKDESKKEEEPKEGEVQLESKKKKKEEDKVDEVVFLYKDGVVKTAVVKRGLSDDTFVEVTGKDLEGSEVVSGPFKAINRDLENDSKVKVENKKILVTGASVETKK
ncbi:MAG: efflux RND transporter periplasmic adaptor subunit [bacterium]